MRKKRNSINTLISFVIDKPRVLIFCKRIYKQKHRVLSYFHVLQFRANIWKIPGFGVWIRSKLSETFNMEFDGFRKLFLDKTLLDGIQAKHEFKNLNVLTKLSN